MRGPVCRSSGSTLDLDKEDTGRISKTRNQHVDPIHVCEVRMVEGFKRTCNVFLRLIEQSLTKVAVRTKFPSHEPAEDNSD